MAEGIEAAKDVCGVRNEVRAQAERREILLACLPATGIPGTRTMPALKDMPARVRLPNRRPSHIETLEVGGQIVTACVGFDPATDRPCEVFLNGGKEGSQVDAMLADAATVISVALQFGVPIGALAKSVGRGPNASTMPGSLDQLNAGGQPASPIGAALDLLMAHEPRPNGEPAGE